MTERIHDDVERALEAFGGVKFSYHTFGRFAIQPRLWVTAEKNPPPLDLPPMDDDEASDGQPRFEMDAPAVRLVEPPAPTLPAQIAEPPPPRDLTWVGPAAALGALPPRRPEPVAAPEEEREVEPMRVPEPTYVAEPAYEADLDREPMPAFGRAATAAPAPVEVSAFVPGPAPAEAEPAQEAVFFPGATQAPEPEPEPPPLAVTPVISSPIVSLPVAPPVPLAVLFAAPPPGEPVAQALPPSNLLTLAALSNAWHAAPVAPASDQPPEPKSSAPPPAAPPPDEAARAQAPAAEPEGDLNIFQLAWSRAAVTPDNAETPDKTAGTDNAGAADRAGPGVAVQDAPMPSEKDLFRRI